MASVDGVRRCSNVPGQINALPRHLACWRLKPDHHSMKTDIIINGLASETVCSNISGALLVSATDAIYSLPLQGVEIIGGPSR